MIVDDDKLMREALSIMISEVPGFCVRCEAGDGNTAIALCKNNHIDILFLDIAMPGMTGLEAGKIISRDNPDMAICMISTFEGFHLAKDAIEIKARKYLSKPISKIAVKNFLEEFKHNQKKEEHPQIRKAVELVEQGDYYQMYTQLGQIVSDVYHQMANNPVLMRQTFLMIGESLMGTLDEFEKREKIQERYPLQKGWMENEEVMKLWLFRVMDYVYQKRGIKRYGILDQVFLYIERHLKEDISLSQIVSNCMISQGYLSRIFRKQFGISVMEYIRLRKIHLAKMNLVFTNDNVSEIAYKIGFNEGSYFSKVFRKYEGISIKEYKLKTGL